MAIGDVDAPRSASEMASAQSGGLSNSTALVPVPTALHQMHNGRVVSHAGRMVSGSLVPVPSVRAPRHRSSGKSWRATAGVAAAAFVFTLGAVALFAGAINKNRVSQVSANASGKTVTGQETPMQTLAVSEVRPATGKREFAETPLRTKEKPAQTGGIRNASNLSVKNLSGNSGEALPVRVSVQRGQAEEYSFVMFRGVPKEVTISAGFRVKETWAVALRDLDRLSLSAPAGFEGSFNLEVVLIKGQNTPAEKQQMAVTIRNSGVAAAKPEPAAVKPPLVTASIQPLPRSAALAAPAKPRAASTTPSPQQPPLPAAQEAVILDKAATLVSANDVSGARLLFEYAANRGSSKAALAMGQTFDPAFFRTAEIIGMRPDAGKAKEWYQKAVELGNKEAASRLSALETQ